MSVTPSRTIEQELSSSASLSRSIRDIRKAMATRQEDGHPVILDTEEWGQVQLTPYCFTHSPCSPPWITEQVFTARRDRETWYVWIDSKDWRWKAVKEYFVTGTGPVTVWREATPTRLTSLDQTEDTND
jgi:hypothetical protein